MTFFGPSNTSDRRPKIRRILLRRPFDFVHFHAETMASSLQSSSQRTCIVSEALEGASKALSEALVRVSLSQESEIDVKAGAVATAAPQAENAAAVDPNDLAAAFFAKQAKPPSLPADEWAMLVLLREKKTQMTSDDQESTKAPSADLQQDLDSLYQGFQRAAVAKK